MKKLLSIAFALIAFSLAGCGALGIQQPQSVDQTLAYAHGTVDSARIAAATGLSAGTVKLEQAKHIRDVANKAEKILDEAQAAKAISDAAASNKAMQATTLLLELQNFLIATGSK